MTALNDLPAEYLECRADRHHHRHETDEDLVYRRGQLVRLTRVTRCDVCSLRVREDLQVPEFTRIPGTRRRPEYPPGYLLKGGPRLGRGEVLSALYQRKGWLSDRQVQRSATTRERMLAVNASRTAG